MGDYKDWSGWIQAGHFINYDLEDGYRYYEHVENRDFAHWEYTWFERVAPESESGPVTLEDLVITLGLSERDKSDRLWQLIWGMRHQVYLYVELPGDVHRHGIPKSNKPGTANWKTSHFCEYMSPYHEPSFLTEHIMKRPETDRITFSVYNPDGTIYLQPELNFMLAKISTTLLGTYHAKTGLVATSPIYDEILGKLHKKTVPCKPLSLFGVRGPAAQVAQP